MQLRLGFTWMDSGKFLVAPTILLLIEWVSLNRRCDHLRRLGWRIGSVATIVGLGFLSLGVALEFWPFPWGSYALRFEEAALPRIGGVIQAVASLVFTVGTMAQSFDLVRTKVIPAWVALVLILGAFTTFFLTPVTWIPGAAWLVFGWMLSRQRQDYV
jgi:hypothetical protein